MNLELLDDEVDAARANAKACHEHRQREDSEGVQHPLLRFLHFSVQVFSRDDFVTSAAE